MVACDSKKLGLMTQESSVLWMIFVEQSSSQLCEDGVQHTVEHRSMGTIEKVKLLKETCDLGDLSFGQDSI